MTTVAERPEVARRPLYMPRPGATPVERELLLAKNDIVNLWRWMDGWHAMGYTNPRAAAMFIHLQLEYHGTRIEKIERMLRREPARKKKTS